MLIVLVSSNRSFTTKCVSLNNEPHVNRLTLINLNPLALNYYKFMIRLNKFDIMLLMTYL